MDEDCAQAASGGLVCAHLKEFYPEIVGDPVVYLVIANDEWPPDTEIVQVTLENGDDCHHNAGGVHERRFKKAFKARPWSTYTVCGDQGPRPLEQTDIDQWRLRFG